MPQEQPLTVYHKEIRRLAYSTRTLLPALRSIKWQVTTVFEDQNELEQELGRCYAAYEKIVDDSQIAAVKLSTTMNMYASLQYAFQTASSAGVIHEMTTFKKTTDATECDFSPRLDAVHSAVEQFLKSLPPSTADKRNISPEGSQTGWVGSASSALQAAVYHLLWAPWFYVGGLLAPKPVRYSPNAVQQHGEHVVEGSIFNEDADSAPEVIANIRQILTALDAQRAQFGVFQEIASELVGDFDRYSAALKAAEGQPKKPAKVEAAQRAHAAAASRAAEWKELGRVLNVEYARA